MSGQPRKGCDDTSNDEILARLLAEELKEEFERECKLSSSNAPRPNSSTDRSDPRGQEGQPGGGKAFSDMLNGLVSYKYKYEIQCHHCNRPLTGTYTTCLSRNYHKECLLCSICHRMLGSGPFIVRDNEPCHPHCHKEVFSIRCSLCVNPIEGTYYKNPYWVDEIYCSSCHERSHSCFSCKRREPSREARREGFAEFPDGRWSCMECVDSAIVDSAEAAPVYAKIVAFMETELGFRIPEGMRDVPILAVDIPTLNEQSKYSDKHMGSTTRGITLCQKGHRHVVKHHTGTGYGGRAGGGGWGTHFSLLELEEYREVSAVCVLFGLPSALCASILAHEAMHVWIKLQKEWSFELPKQVEEGLCQLVAEKYLSYVIENPNGRFAVRGAGGKRETDLDRYFRNSIETDTSPVYGEGFRAAAKCCSEIGIDVLLEFVRDNKKFPEV